MNKIEIMFDRMDEWRHLPNYQLERRADLFFSLYLPEVLKAKLGFHIQKQIIPEFPVRIGTIYPDKPNNQSKHIDYLALSTDSENAVFVELKTDGRSRNEKQDEYLKRAQKVGMSKLLKGLLEIFRGTKAKRKYFCLFTILESMGLIRIPSLMTEIMSRSNLKGVTEASRKVEISSKVKECLIVYVQPNGTGPDIISFDKFRATVTQHDDPVSKRFAQSLTEWAKIQAGKRDLSKELKRSGPAFPRMQDFG